MAAEKKGKTIGVAGGMGPYAGLDLVRKIFDQTLAARDQDHLSVALLSFPADIPDRTEFLQGKTKENPAERIADVLLALERSGAEVAGVPCNTSHSEPIFSALRARLRAAGSRLKLLHMIEETARFAAAEFSGLANLGVLCTTGAYRAGVFPTGFAGSPIRILLPDEKIQAELVHPAIYDPEWGIKAQSNPASDRARDRLVEAWHSLRRQGAEGVVLGCTEIPLAFPDGKVDGAIGIDPSLALARALIREAAPEKLKPFR